MDKQIILDGIRRNDIFAGPFHLELHLEDRCNFNCFFCSSRHFRRGRTISEPCVRKLVRQMRKAGTYSVRILGEGEALLHGNFTSIMKLFRESGIRMENITTNLSCLTPEMSNLIAENCDTLIVSLNTADPESFSKMMRVKPACFFKVIDNIKYLVYLRGPRGKNGLKIKLQFLVWKENFRDILRMYRLARDLKVDEILFNGIDALPSDRRMSPAEIREMLLLYGEIIREDEYRSIGGINSYEVDLGPSIGALSGILQKQREEISILKRVYRFVTREGYSLKEKMSHHLHMRKRKHCLRAAFPALYHCLIAWYSMVIRTDGTVIPCCVLGNRVLGNVYSQTLEDIWKGEQFRRFRSELISIIDGTAAKNPADIHPVCLTLNGCPATPHSYASDEPFVRKFTQLAREIQIGAGIPDPCSNDWFTLPGERECQETA